MQPTVTPRPKRTTLVLVLLIGPTALLIITFILYAISNLAFGVETTPQPVGAVVVNIILFLTGAVGVITWLPGLIAGIILLTKK